MAAPEVERERAALRASGLRESDPEAYRRRAFELSVAGYFKDFHDANKLTPFRVTARTQQAVWDSLGEFDLRDRLRRLPLPSPPSLVLPASAHPTPIPASPTP